MNWMAKVSLMLIFTLVFSTFMHQGWYKPKPADAAVAYRVCGTALSGVGAISPAPGAGHATNDIDLLFVETANEASSLSTPAGFVELANIGYGTAAAADATRLTVFWRRWNGTDGTPTVADSGNNQIGVMCSYSGVVTYGDPWNVFGTNTQNTATTAGSVSAITTTLANTLLVIATAGALPDAQAIPATEFSGWTNANLTGIPAADRSDSTTSSGNGGSLGVTDGTKATAGSTGATTFTTVTSSTKANMHIALKPTYPVVTSPTASNVLTTTATLGATVASDGGGGALSARGTCWATTAAPTTNCVAEGGTAVSAFTQNRTGITEGSLIYYRGYATNATGTDYSPDGIIYTEPTQPNTLSFTSVGQNGMTVNWAIGSTGNADSVIVVMKAGSAVDADPVDAATYTADAAFGSGTQIGTGNYVLYKGTGTNVAVTGLSPSTTYYVKIYAFAAGAGGTENYNTTSPLNGSQATTGPPILTSPTSTSILSTTATLGADITSNGGAAITARGTCWNTTTPVVNVGGGGNNCSAEGGTATGVFTQALTGLTAGSIIYYKGYATNANGTAYSPEGSFYTEPATQASGVSFTLGRNYMLVNWSGSGSGDGVIVLMKSGSAVNSDPVDGTYTGYTANSVFGSGTQIGTGNYVLFKGSGSSVKVTGLTSGTTYYVAVYAYMGMSDTSGVNLGTNYKQLTPATGNQLFKPGSTVNFCSDCHGYTSLFPDGTTRNNPAGTFPGSHETHVVQYSYVCSKCHVVPATETSANFYHRNGNIQMATNINGDTGGAYGKISPWAQTNTPSAMQSCANVYCHSQGVSATSNSGDTRATMSSPNATVNWGGSTICSSCHANPPSYTNGDTTWGAAKANSHSVHTTSCQTCHNSTTTDGTTIANIANHPNRLYNISVGSGEAIGSYSYAVLGGTCTNISCHGGVAGTYPNVNDAAWGSSLDCTTCHNKGVNAPKASAASGGTVTSRRNITTEFSGARGHAKTAAMTKQGCAVCHMEGDPSTGQANLSYHGNGYIELRDPDTNATIKEVSWSGTTPGSYSSTGTDAKVVRFARDTASNTLETYATAVQINHCLKCHDADGVAITAARVSTGSATQPFGTTAGTRVDVNSQFSTSNATYHPVTGKQNNWYADTDTMNSPWNPAARGGGANNTTYGYLLTCWDCHDSSATGRAVTASVTAHGNAVTVRAPYDAVSKNATQLCVVCHKQSVYWGVNGGGTAGQGYTHVAGNGVSALQQDNPLTEWVSGRYHDLNAWAYFGCTVCHGFTDKVGVMPTTNIGYNVHGTNTVGSGGATWTTSGQKPYSFLRNTSTMGDWNMGYCNMAGSNQCRGTTGNYTPGGTY